MSVLQDGHVNSAVPLRLPGAYVHTGTCLFQCGCTCFNTAANQYKVGTDGGCKNKYTTAYCYLLTTLEERGSKGRMEEYDSIASLSKAQSGGKGRNGWQKGVPTMLTKK